MGSCRCDRSPRESQLGRIDPVTQPCGPSSTDLQLPKAPPAALRRSAALPDPALRCGENSRPGKVRHRLEDSREAILWFYDTRLSSVSGFVFGTNVANRANRVAK